MFLPQVFSKLPKWLYSRISYVYSTKGQIDVKQLRKAMLINTCKSLYSHMFYIVPESKTSLAPFCFIENLHNRFSPLIKYNLPRRSFIIALLQLISRFLVWLPWHLRIPHATLVSIAKLINRWTVSIYGGFLPNSSRHPRRTLCIVDFCR